MKILINIYNKHTFLLHRTEANTLIYKQQQKTRCKKKLPGLNKLPWNMQNALDEPNDNDATKINRKESKLRNKTRQE